MQTGLADQGNPSPAFAQRDTFRIERYMDEFHRLMPNDEIQAIEEKCVREHYDPAEEAHQRSLHRAHVPGTRHGFE